MRASLISLLLILLSASASPAQQFTEHPHPFYYTQDRIATAKSNVAMHPWARSLADSIIALADEAVVQSDDALRNWISQYTPISQCDCPYCGRNWLDQVWIWDKANPDQIRCRYCDNITSLEHFPENDALQIADPQGVIRPHPVYRDKTGKIFPIRELLYFHKDRQAYSWIENLGIAYVLTGKRHYAQKAAVLLKRLAEVYRGFAIHDNFRFERYPFGWAGKLRGWHYTDAYTLQDAAATYDAIYHSGILNDADKMFLEDSLFQVGLDFLTAVKPSQGISNDMPYRYAGVAMLARTLENHAGVSWVLDKDEGYEAFLHDLFALDGTWHEGAPGYQNMVARVLHETVEILDGYSDPESYIGPNRFENLNLKTLKPLPAIYSIQLAMRFPDGNLPAVNDGKMGTRPDPVPLEALYNWTGEKRWLALSNQAYDGKMRSNGKLYSLFNRKPDIDSLLATLPQSRLTPDSSRNFSGMGLTMLRRGHGDDQVVMTLHHHKYTTPHSHYDALSTILFASGREMLSDFGYPSFSSPLRMSWYLKSLSHNTLTVNTQNQFAPFGVANWLHHGELFSAAEAEAWEAYRFICEPFFRQIALVEGQDGSVYAVDIFRAQGGEVHDFALHGEGDTLLVAQELTSAHAKFKGMDSAYEHFDAVKIAETEKNWRASWVWRDGVKLKCHFTGQRNTQIVQAITPGERTLDMRGREKYSLVARRRGDALRSEFAAVYEPGGDGAAIQSADKVLVSGDRDWAVVLKVRFPDLTQYILSSYLDISAANKPFVDGEIEIAWQSRFGVVNVRQGKIVRQEWVKGVMEGLRHIF